MALIFTEGFDHYTITTNTSTVRLSNLNLEDRYTIGTLYMIDPYMSFTSGVPGSQVSGYALTSGDAYNTNNQMSYVFPSALTTFYIGMAYKSDLGTGPTIISLENAAGSYIRLRLNAYLPTIVTSTNTYPADVQYTQQARWNYYELGITITGSTANVSCWIDNVQVFALTGITWYSSGNQSIELFKLGKYDTSTVGYQYWDHMYIDNSSRLGPVEISLLRPSADTSTKQWTPSSGTTNFDKVGETTNQQNSTSGRPTMTTAVSAFSAGVKDYYELPDLGNMNTNNQVVGVTPLIFCALQNSASAGSTIGVNLTSGGIPYKGLPIVSPTVNYDTGQLTKFTPLNTNPLTSSPWTYTDINNLKLGIEMYPVPDSSTDPFWNDVVMLANFDIATQPSNTSVIITAHDATGKTNANFGNVSAVTFNGVGNTRPEFGLTVGNINGANAWCNITPNGTTSTINDWAYADEFTIEFWFRPTAYNASSRGLMSVKDATVAYNATNTQWMITDYTDSRGLTLEISIAGTVRSINLTSRAVTFMPLTTWSYVAISRDIDGYIRWFINGNMVGKIGPFLGALPAVGYLRLFNRLGTDTDTSGSFTLGAFDEIRFTKKCRYATDAAIAIPTTPFPRP